MDKKIDYLEKVCPKCGTIVIVRKVTFFNQQNKPGYIEVACLDCHEVFEIYINGDVDASTVEKGAKILNRRYRD
jgi:phage FluMu protein Com